LNEKGREVRTKPLSCPFSRVPDAEFHPGLFLPVALQMQACAVEGGH
jgi:hypothetical protein